MTLLDELEEAGGDGTFGMLRAISQHAQGEDEGSVSTAREALVRLLDEPDRILGYEPLVNDLLALVGLFPYVDTGTVDVRTALQHAIYDSPVSGRVFHRAQAQVYNLLQGGKNVVLSAPTSFGKSAILDAVLVDGLFARVVIVVPTIALIDETRRRLARLPHGYKIVTQPSQEIPERFVAILTQERALELPSDLQLDFFAIDEFYKLSESGDPDRTELLNAAFYRLWKTGAQFYLLGPNVEVLEEVPHFDVEFIRTDFRTVAANYLLPPDGDSDEERLERLTASLEEGTLIYVRSPKQAREVAETVLRATRGQRGAAQRPETETLVEWLSGLFSPDWDVVRFLSNGIGVHHGKLPRSLASKMVELFDSGELRFLVCTSTLIEGVNTAAKNVIVYSNRVANSKYDFFTFNNIVGRSGRMKQHFVGNVYLFQPIPEETLRSIEFPVFSQSDDASDSLLLQVGDDDLNASARTRVDVWATQTELPIELLRQSPGIDPVVQVEIARRLRAMSTDEWLNASWSGYPSRANIHAVIHLAFRRLTPSRSNAVRSEDQLMYLLGRLQASSSLTGFIQEQIVGRRSQDTVDDAIDGSLEFLRSWAGFHVPRALSVLQRIQNHVATERSGPEADYRLYAALVEQYFEPYPAVLLEEYGIPIQIGSQILEGLALEGPTLDETLEMLRNQKGRVLRMLSPVERSVAGAAIAEL